MIKGKWPDIKSFPPAFWPMLAVIVTIVVFIPSINYNFLPEWDDANYVAGEHLKLTLDNLLYWLTGSTLKLWVFTRICGLNNGKYIRTSRQSSGNPA